MQYIGSELQDRMNLLGIDVSALSEITFMDEETICDIIENRISYEDVDEFDMSLICSALHCDAQYFIDGEVRNKDLLISTMNRGKDSVKSKNVKAKIQDFMSDFAFVNEVLLANDPSNTTDVIVEAASFQPRRALLLNGPMLIPPLSAFFVS